jgi:hypothetical protein
MLREQGVERGGYHGRELEPRNSNRYLLGVILRISEIYPLAITQASWYLPGTNPPASQDNAV